MIFDDKTQQLVDDEDLLSDSYEDDSEDDSEFLGGSEDDNE